MSKIKDWIIPIAVAIILTSLFVYNGIRIGKKEIEIEAKIVRNK